MNSYFFNITPQEKENILSKHKEVYDGYVTNYIKPNQEPLYVQDFANDKGGITVNNKGVVSPYKNMNINEDVFSGSKFEPEDTFEQLDMIGDGDYGLSHGTFDGSTEDCEFCTGSGIDEFNEEPCEWCDGTGFKNKSSHHFDIDTEPKFNNVGDLDVEIDSDKIEPIYEQVNKTLDMFRRFKKY
jgi:hypothetical protein